MFSTQPGNKLPFIYRFFLGSLLLLALSAIVPASVHAQNQYDVKGTVKKSRKKLEGAVVTLYKGSTQVSQQTTAANGRFDLKMDLNGEYTLTVGKPGHITKKFYFNTKGVPEDRAKEEFGGQDIEVSIFEMPKDPGVVSQINSILSQPMAKFYYDDNIKEIDFDKAYSQAMVEALDKLNQIEKEAIKKAEEEEKNKSAAESAAASKYEAAIIKGDAAFGKKDYTTARAAYTEALSIKPGEEYPKNKIVEIEKLIADAAKNAQIDADYKAAIARADAAFTAKNYEAAKTSYNDALKIKPAEAYPKTKLDEIAKLAADAAKTAELEAKYKAALQKADAAFTAKTYDVAKTAYTEAAGLKPAEKYPKDKLAEIDKILADAAAKDAADKALNEKYTAAIAKADKALAAKDYTNAKAGYTEASGVKPAEAYPKTKLAEIDKLLADLAAKENADKELKAKYDAAVARGDKALGTKDYAGAKAAYSEALGYKPTEQYPKDKLAECDKAIADAAAKDAAEKDRLAKEKALNDKYNAAIAKGDAALAKKDYTTAKAGYNEALGAKPAEQYPKDKIAEIDKAIADAASAAAAEKDRLAKEKELNDKYNAAIAKADAAMKTKTYEAAKAAYNDALALKASEQYPKDKLAEIDGLLAKDAASKELNAKYTAAIAKGDAAFKAKTWEDAKAGYNEALGLKPAEAYPKAQLVAIDKAIADAAAKDAAEAARLAKEKELSEKYTAAIAKGDAAFGSKDYEAAKTAYTEASTLKATEKYPKDKITEINAIIAKEMGAKELEKKYADAIAKADAGLGAKDYTTAKAQYTAALALKPNEQYPKDKLAEVDKALGDAAAAKALNDKYTAAIAKGDAAMKAKTYEAAKAAYNDALTLKASEQYPKDKLAEIDGLLAKDAASKELNAKYTAAIAKADAAFKAKTWEDAKAAYNEALGLKSAEAYPKAQLAAIDKAIADAAAKDAAEAARLAKEKELAEKYAAAIARGDAAFGTKDYDGAKAAYNEAIALKATEKYPKDKITEINAILAKEMGAKELEKKYADAIAKADAGLGAKDYATAKAQYTAALALKPNEQYPKDKLAEVDKVLGEAAAAKSLNDKYNAAIAKGDAAFKLKTWAAAKTAYNEALGLKAEEQYPKDKIAEIDAMIAKEMGAKELDDKYKAAVAKGDAAFKTKTWEDAKAGYNEALGFKPAEAYPKTQLAAIDKAIADAAAKDAAEAARLAKEKELTEKYAAAIAKGDAAFGTKDYDGAKAAYNEAIALKAAEKYPKDKITEINAILAKEMGAKELEKKYADAIAKADAGLGAKDYTTAKAQYTAALALKPNEQYPKDKLSEVDKALADLAAANKLKEQEAKYTAAIAKGDAALAAKTYAAAKTAYTEASTLKPSEQYPKDKLSEIDKLMGDAAAEKDRLAKEKALNDKYNAAIARGDAAFKLKTWAAAKTAYNEALGLKPGEQYPTDKLAEIDGQIAAAASEKDKAALEAKYKAAVAKGDAAFKLKTWEAAKAAYNEALGLKPGEAYPSGKISEIDKLLADLADKDAANKALSEKYNAAIAKGDAAFGSKDYDGAKAAYNEAIALKATEKYPKDKLAAIDALLAKEAGAKEQEARYKAAIAKGDEAFTAKDYAAAKTAYTEAGTLKPSEQYPKDQLAKVSSALADLAKGQALQAKYDAAVKKADDLLAKKDYNNAILAYKDAQAIKAGEPYPGNKIAEINSTLDEIARQKEKDAQYKDMLAKADKLFELKDYKSAKSRYLDASLLKSSEQYPKDKAAECDVLIKKKNTTVTATTSTVKDDFKSELAKKYPEGITEETGNETNARVTRRIVVRGNEGHMYVKKETSFGPVYYFKDNVPITEGEFMRDTEVQPQ
jgi:hypothetical protein